MLKAFLAFVSLFGFCQSSLAAVEAKDPRCPAPQPLREFNMTPQLIPAWLRTVGSKVKTIEDFICCLPEQYRKNYIVGHSSVAGQNGTPREPRVILFNELSGKPPKPLKLALSINTGAPKLLQGNAVEMAAPDPQTKDLNYFDLPFGEKGFPHVAKNPKLCLSCHGEYEKIPLAGPKSIFDVFPHWPRFVGGAFSCNANDDKLQSIVSMAARDAILSNPRFKCLDKSLVEPNDINNPEVEKRFLAARAKVEAFDAELFKISTARINRITSAHPSFQKLKFIIMGHKLFCDVKFSRWIPKDELDRVTAKVRLSSDFKRGKTAGEIFERQLNTALKDLSLLREKGKILSLTKEDVEGALKNGMSMETKIARCKVSPNNPTADPERFKELWAKHASTKVEDLDLHELLKIDSSLKNNFAFNDSIIRLMTEGYNLDSSSFNRSPLASAAVEFTAHGLNVLPHEPENSPISKMFAQQDQGPRVIREESKTYALVIPAEEACEKLRLLSLAAFSNSGSVVDKISEPPTTR